MLGTLQTVGPFEMVMKRPTSEAQQSHRLSHFQSLRRRMIQQRKKQRHQQKQARLIQPSRHPWRQCHPRMKSKMCLLMKTKAAVASSAPCSACGGVVPETLSASIFCSACALYMCIKFIPFVAVYRLKLVVLPGTSRIRTGIGEGPQTERRECAVRCLISWDLI